MYIFENTETLKKLSEFYSIAEETEKFLLLFGLIKLRLVKGKVLIFVNSLNRGYKVKLFLEKFSVPVGVLNNELPYNTRMNVINQFNSGVLGNQPLLTQKQTHNWKMKATFDPNRKELARKLYQVIFCALITAGTFDFYMNYIV